MPRANGINVLQCIWTLDRSIPVYVHSSQPTFRFNGEEIELGSFIKDFFGTFATFRLKGMDLVADIVEFAGNITPREK